VYIIILISIILFIIMKITATGILFYATPAQICSQSYENNFNKFIFDNSLVRFQFKDTELLKIS